MTIKRHRSEWLSYEILVESNRDFKIYSKENLFLGNSKVVQMSSLGPHKVCLIWFQSDYVKNCKYFFFLCVRGALSIYILLYIRPHVVKWEWNQMRLKSAAFPNYFLCWFYFIFFATAIGCLNPIWAHR